MIKRTFEEGYNAKADFDKDNKPVGEPKEAYKFLRIRIEEAELRDNTELLND